MKMKKPKGTAGAPEIRTILFDLDGTLIDTEKAAAQAIQIAFSKWGVEVNASDASYVTGRTWSSAFEYLFEKYTVPKAREEALTQVMATYRETLEKHLPVVPGSVEAVRSLAKNYSLALVSGSYRKEILWALKKLNIDSHFSVILGAEDYPRSKPAPDPYEKAVKLLKADPLSSLVFEDSNAGISSALAAGLWVVAITGTNHFSQNTTSAHHQISDLTGVSPAWIKEVSQNFLRR